MKVRTKPTFNVNKATYLFPYKTLPDMIAFFTLYFSLHLQGIIWNAQFWFQIFP